MMTKPRARSVFAVALICLLGLAVLAGIPDGRGLVSSYEKQAASAAYFQWHHDDGSFTRITFTAFGPDGANYTWDFDDGSVGSGETVTHTFTEGEYTVTLTTHGDGSTSNARTLTISSDSPVADFTWKPPTPTTQTEVHFWDTSIDPDNEIQNWTWDFDDGTVGYGPSINHTFADSGIHNVTLAIGNATSGMHKSVTKQIFVFNKPPVANFYWTKKNGAIQFNAATDWTNYSRDIDGNIVNYTWSFGDGNISYVRNPIHLYAKNDTYPVSLTVRDDDGATDTVTKDVDTGNYLPDAEAFIHPTEATIRTHVTFNDSSVDMDGSIVNRTWAFGDGTVSHERNTTHRYSEKGTFTVTLTVIDDGHAYNTTTREIEVVNLPPDIFVSWEPMYPAVNENVTFVNYSVGPGCARQNTTDLDGSITNQTWLLDDQTAGYGPNLTHAFSTNGIHTVTLEVTDDSGDTNRSTRQVHVADIYVDDNRSEDWYDHNHVRTIQEGVDNASAGNLIHVLPGSYREQVVVNKSVFIVGDNASVDGSGGTAFIISADDAALHDLTIANASLAVNVTADNVHISGSHVSAPAALIKGDYAHVSSNTFQGEGQGNGTALRIEGSHTQVAYNRFIETPDGIAVVDGINHTIEANTFREAIIHAVQVKNAQDCTISNNTFRGNYIAIDTIDQGCSIAGNILHDNYKAILLRGTDNMVYNNTLTGNEIGIEVTKPGNMITGNTIQDSQEMAIHLSSSGTEIEDCMLAGNVVGVNASGSGQSPAAIIHNVTFSQTVKDSISLYNAAATIDACTFSGVSRGIFINQSTNITVQRSTFVNGTTGIAVEDADPVIRQCDIAGFDTGIVSRGRGTNINRSTVHNNTVGLLLQGENTSLADCLIRDNDDGVSSRGAHNLTIHATIRDNARGVYVEQGTNISIQGALFANNTDAVSLEDTHDVTVTGCSIETSDTAIALVDASSCRVTDNTVHDNHLAIKVLTAPNNTFSGNNLSRNHVGFLLSRAPSNTLLDNTMADNDYAIDLEGRSISHYYQDIDTSNEVNGQPVYYYNDTDDINTSTGAPEDGQYGYLGFVSCDNVTISGATTQPNGEGLLLVDVHNASIGQGSFTHSRDGIVLFASTDCSITGTNVSGNADDGVTMIGGTHNVSITGCTIAGNGQRGINLYRSTGGSGNLRISSSHVVDNWLGVNIENADSNVIENLTLSGNQEVAVRLYKAADITAVNLTLHDNRVGLEIIRSSARVDNVTAHHHDTAVTVTDGTADLHDGFLHDNDVGIAATRATLTLSDAALRNHSTAILADDATVSAAATSFETNDRALHAVSSAVAVDTCSIVGNGYGLLLENVDAAYVGNCTDAAVIANNTYGVFVNHSDGATISNCSLRGNENAVTVTASSDTAIDGCRAANNTDAVTVMDAHHTALNGSLLHHNVHALDIRSNTTTVTRCSFWKNMYGVRILAGRNNSIYHNNFAYNMEQAFDAGGNNSWDDGYPSGGNYWSNYAGTNHYTGPSQNKSGIDGIGDIPYPIKGGPAMDIYPLMNMRPDAAAIPNSPPQAAFFVYPSQPLSNDGIDFVDHSTDPNGKSDIVSWTWTFGDGASSSLQHPSHVYEQPGNYTVTLTVTDSQGANSSHETNITVTNTPPVARFTVSPRQPAVGETVQFTDDSRDSNGHIVTWNWTFGDGSVSSQQSPSHSYSDAGTYTVSLTVTDDNGATDTYTMDVTSSGTAPTAAFSVSPSQPKAGEAVSFTDLSTDDGSIVTWHWEFGDGNASTAQNPSYEYDKAGTYTVTLTVWDDDGVKNTTTKTVTVKGDTDTPGFALPLLLLAVAVAAVALRRRRGKV